MNVMPLPLLSGSTGLACLFVGRVADGRPDPRCLLPLLGMPAPEAVPLARARQIHSNRCLFVRGRAGLENDGIAGEGDAILTDTPGVALAVATADCVPLAAYDPAAGVLAVIHAGWRGTVSGVLESALMMMASEAGAAPERILLSAGPAAGVCCYRVGHDVVDAFVRERTGPMDGIFREAAPGVTHMDLVEANRLQALAFGIPRDNIGSIRMCTVCHPALFHSYRRDGASAGRMWLLAAMTEITPPSS